MEVARAGVSNSEVSRGGSVRCYTGELERMCKYTNCFIYGGVGNTALKRGRKGSQQLWRGRSV